MQEDATVSLHPNLVKEFCTLQVSAKILSCGSHHNAVITQDGELYTWGSNHNYCLGHQIDEKHVEYTPKPGHCGGFGAIVDRVGRGMPRSVACGKEFTLVATYPYGKEGPQPGPVRPGPQMRRGILARHVREVRRLGETVRVSHA